MKRLVLIGGGHAHVEVLRQFAQQPLPDLNIHLVTPHQHAAYSGMLPGWIAGRYRADECQVALAPLTHRAKAQVTWDSVIGISVEANLVFTAGGKQLPFDIVSIDTGSSPPTIDIPGADAYALAVKPIEPFMLRWERVLQDAKEGRTPRMISIVGTGAAGLEVATAMHQRLTRIQKTVQFQVVGAMLLPSHNARVQGRYRRLLSELGIGVHLGVPVARVTATHLRLADGSSLESDLAIWATGSGAPMWPRACGLATDAQGFIRVNDCLRSVSSPHVFAAGDIATMEPDARPKSGVYAVRAGPHLAENLRRALTAMPALPWHPQSDALALISAGAGHAIASRGALALEGRWVWWWKDWIDRRWIEKYRVVA
jgi:selenide,water dikinase